MPRTKGSKNRPKTNNTDYASQIAEKQESIASLNTEIASITANIDTLKVDLKEKKAALKTAQKELTKPAMQWKRESGEKRKNLLFRTVAPISMVRSIRFGSCSRLRY